MVNTSLFQQFLTKIKDINYVDYIKSIIIAVCLALLFRSFLIEPYSIPTGSMRTTLLEGDYLFASKFSYGYGRYSFPLGLNLFKFEGRILGSEPERGDIIIFHGTKDSRIYIKRLIGFPGDKIQLINRVLYINGAPLQKAYVKDYTDYSICTNDAIGCREFIETLPNGVSYRILQAEHRGNHELVDTTPVYQVPEGHYFFMGDNRNNSIDSRFLNREIGYVPEENLIAKAKFLVFTTDFDKLSRGRFFQIIK